MTTGAVDGQALMALGQLQEAQQDASARNPGSQEAVEAAKQFEGILIQQLMAVLRKTAPQGGMLGGGGFASETYTHMHDQAMAEHLSEGPGLGMRDMLVRSLGGTPEDTPLTGTVHSSVPLAYHAGPTAPRRGDPVGGATGLLQQAADQTMDGGGWHRFSREGRLAPQDLASDFQTQEAGGVARFNVQDARGYQGYYKCNLFAFEVARRAGFSVPVVGRERGWGFPVPNTVTEDASDGAVEGGWSRVATGITQSSMRDAIDTGRSAFMLTGAATEDRAGHMALVERVHEVDYDEGGQVRRVVFDGWEAREGGAQHLTRRTWNRYGNPGGNLARNGFQGIEILELRRTAGQGRPEVPVSRRAGASNLDGPG